MLSSLFSRAGALLAGALAAVLAILAAWRSGKKTGQTEVVAKQAQKEVEHAKKAQKVDSSVATRKPDDVQRKLRDKYSRD